MTQIPLSRGLYALVDDEDYDRVAVFRWYASRCDTQTYAARNVAGRPRSHAYMHRVVLGITDSRQIDHVNGNGLDNRKVNLRVASTSQNAANMRTGPHSSRFRGVLWDRGRWVARITTYGTQRHLGRFVAEEDAARAYDAAAITAWGEFARTNL